MRPLKKEEFDLILALLEERSDTSKLIDELPNLLVKEIDDGGMGCIQLLCGNNKNRKMAKEIARINVLDVDKIPLSITLNLDEQGNLYELAIWKADFAPIRQFPQYPSPKI